MEARLVLVALLQHLLRVLEEVYVGRVCLHQIRLEFEEYLADADVLRPVCGAVAQRLQQLPVDVVDRREVAEYDFHFCTVQQFLPALPYEALQR